MLLAELHGKTCEPARNSEDYLTSAVFGHLRYVPPAAFWDDLFAHAVGLPGSYGREPSLSAMLAAAGCLPSGYTRLTAHFWQSHPLHGEPDLVLVFAVADRPPLVVLVEAKLWAGKSGTREYDQLARYLRALDDPAGLGLSLPPAAARYLVYLTPRESLVEVEESIEAADDPQADRLRVFRLRWQDVLAAARRAAPRVHGPAALVLTDVADFLSRLGLEYFNGFRRVGELPLLTEADGHLYNGGPDRTSGFNDFARVADLDWIACRRGSWVS